ncbi:MAG: Rrf2 family transcriptional regulator [Deltaproteobacteria bacterium]|nr:Rrf2 family transcriptional regulator [Deltaproteobacteria bacterium]
MLSKTAEYALQAIVCLATEARETGLRTEIIAKSTHIPPSYLVKVLDLLARSGITQSQRGLYGGYTLATNPCELTFLDVINAVDPIRRVQHCPVHENGSSEQLCPLQVAIDRAIGAVEKEFASVRLSSLLDASNSKAQIWGGGCHKEQKHSAKSKKARSYKPKTSR